MIALTTKGRQENHCYCCCKAVKVVVLFCHVELCKQCLADALAMALEAERKEERRARTTEARHIRALWLAEMGCCAEEVAASLRHDPPTDPDEEQEVIDAQNRINKENGWEVTHDLD